MRAVLAHKLVFTCTLLLGSCGASSGPEPAFAGSFVGDGLRVELMPLEDGYRGSITLGDSSYDLKASANAGALHGSFGEGDQSSVFDAIWSESKLEWSTRGSTQLLTRIGINEDQAMQPGNEAAASNIPAQATVERPKSAAILGEAARRLEAEQAALAQRVEAAPALTETFRHDAGFFFNYPQGWSLQRGADNLLIMTPPDPYQIDGQRAEVFLVMGDSAAGVTDPRDKRAIRKAEQLIASMLPFLQRTGTLESAASGGVALTWEGQSPAGIDCRARLWATILGDYAIGIFALTPVDRFELRRTVVADMFSTFGLKAPKMDPRLIGQWHHEKLFMSGDFSTISNAYLTLQADQTCFWSSSMMASSSSEDAYGNSIGTYSADTGEAVSRGTFRVVGTKIELQWEGSGDESWSFYVEGDSLLFKSGHERKLWERVR